MENITWVFFKKISRALDFFRCSNLWVLGEGEINDRILAVLCSEKPRGKNVSDEM